MTIEQNTNATLFQYLGTYYVLSGKGDDPSPPRVFVCPCERLDDVVALVCHQSIPEEFVSLLGADAELQLSEEVRAELRDLVSLLDLSGEPMYVPKTPYEAQHLLDAFGILYEMYVSEDGSVRISDTFTTIQCATSRFAKYNTVAVPGLVCTVSEETTSGSTRKKYIDTTVDMFGRVFAFDGVRTGCFRNLVTDAYDAFANYGVVSVIAFSKGGNPRLLPQFTEVCETSMDLSYCTYKVCGIPGVYALLHNTLLSFEEPCDASVAQKKPAKKVSKKPAKRTAKKVSKKKSKAKAKGKE